MGDAAIYAMTKSAVTTLTELLYYQLKTQGTQLSCSVLFPGPNWLRTQLWDAWKTRAGGVHQDRRADDAVPRASRSSSSTWSRPGRRCRSLHSRRSPGACSTRSRRTSSGSTREVTTPLDARVRRDEGPPEPRLLPRLEPGRRRVGDRTKFEGYDASSRGTPPSVRVAQGGSPRVQALAFRCRCRARPRRGSRSRRPQARRRRPGLRPPARPSIPACRR